VLGARNLVVFDPVGLGLAFLILAGAGHGGAATPGAGDEA
jgi:hypothetical protein